MLAETAVELPVVEAVHIAVPVEVEVPEVTGFAGALRAYPKSFPVISTIYAAVR